MNDQAAMAIAHWVWTAFFVLFGVVLVTRARNYAGPNSANCWLRVASPDQNRVSERIEGAVARREAAEGAPPRLGLWMGYLSFLLAAVSASGRVPSALLYAFLCLGMALLIAIAFLRLRNSQPTRVAILAARRPDAVIPPYWLYAAVLSALTLVVYLASPQDAWSASIVMLSSLLTTAIAWKLTNLPALLSGTDIAAEQLVDDRLRFHRSGAALMFAVVQPFVFTSQNQDETTLQTVVFFLGMAIFLAFTVWMMRRFFAKVQLA